MKPKYKEKCIELKYNFNSAIFYLVIDLLFCLIIFTLIPISNDYSTKALYTCSIFSLIMNIVFLPLIIYYIYKYFYIKRNLNKMEIYNVNFNNIETSLFYRHRVYFTVEFETRNGKKIKADTKAMFSSFPVMTLDLNLYKNKIMEIGYDEEREELIVIDIKGD